MSKVSGGFNRSVPDIGGEGRPGWEREKGRPGENAASCPGEVEGSSHEVEGSPDAMEGKAMSQCRGLFGKEENMYF